MLTNMTDYDFPIKKVAADNLLSRGYAKYATKKFGTVYFIDYDHFERDIELARAEEAIGDNLAKSVKYAEYAPLCGIFEKTKAETKLNADIDEFWAAVYRLHLQRLALNTDAERIVAQRPPDFRNRDNAYYISNCILSVYDDETAI